MKQNDAHPKPAPGRPGLRWLLRIGGLAGVLGFAIPAFAQDPGEIAFWKSVQNTKNPAELQAYLDAYPQGRFAALARVRIAALRGNAAPTPRPAPPASAKEQTPAGSASTPHPRESQSGAAREAPAAAANQGEAVAGSESLSAAIRDGKLEAAKEAVAKGANANAPDESGMTPIGLAAMLGRTEIITFLAASGADLNRNDRFGFTPLMNAAIRGQVDAARLLIALGANPALKGGNGSDAIGAARPYGSGDPRFEGKVAVEKMLEAAMATHAPSGGSGAARQ